MMMVVVMTVMVKMLAMQASARRAEKALQEILHKADHDSNGRVRAFYNNWKNMISQNFPNLLNKSR